jgi:hypothetical protein
MFHQVLLALSCFTPTIACLLLNIFSKLKPVNRVLCGVKQNKNTPKVHMLSPDKNLLRTSRNEELMDPICGHSNVSLWDFPRDFWRDSCSTKLDQTPIFLSNKTTNSQSIVPPLCLGKHGGKVSWNVCLERSWLQHVVPQRKHLKM